MLIPYIQKCVDIQTSLEKTIALLLQQNKLKINGPTTLGELFRTEEIFSSFTISFDRYKVVLFQNLNHSENFLKQTLNLFLTYHGCMRLTELIKMRPLMTSYDRPTFECPETD